MKEKAIILLGTGWTIREVAEVLLLDDETIRSYLKRYKTGELNALLNDNYKGYSGKLCGLEIFQLDEHLNENTYLSTKEVVSYVAKRFRVDFSVSGMTGWLHLWGDVYKKLKLVPGKADAKAQEEFISSYRELKSTKGATDPIYFMDGTHPQHKSVVAYGWIKKGATKELKSNTGRRRLNINGAIDVENTSISVDYGVSINAQSTISLLEEIELKHTEAETIYVICDNARYYKTYHEFQKTSK
ncbi:MAG: IS630 family transposase [Candidatus Scalindua sp.]|nr:IS630 family transposase [Candidatus Scalindua sp.]MBT5307213.1 IS630 family transposase [Candidatus Scalindua sp.]MBT6049202.1 IS630 family transposase [Candidatus Scalindua sp.]MBT6230653.1 IS630 family transposase [Candidatus Scalindua sp.]MBT6564171.1 IS630 family transposase [Candidatus Scalindua sp.]